MRKIVNFFLRKLTALFGTNYLPRISNQLENLNSVSQFILIDNYLLDSLFKNEKYFNSKRITHYHKSVYTQNGEDGIIAEIFNRIGTTNKYFVEFGVHGIKNNSTLLLVKNWQGLWVGGSAEAENFIKSKFNSLLSNGSLQYLKEWITSENIESLFEKANVPKEFDFLSIDLDGNDYWIWNAIEKYRPRVVSVEYNATIPPDVLWVMKYNPSHQWDQTSYFGASLKSLQLLGTQKGYKLVGCDFNGCNAFFIRADEDLNLFEQPFTAEHHYEPPRYALKISKGHHQGFGPFESR